MIVKTDSSSASFCKVTFVVRSFHSLAHHSLSRRQFLSKVEAMGRDEGTVAVPGFLSAPPEVASPYPGSLIQCPPSTPWLFVIGAAQFFVMWDCGLNARAMTWACVSQVSSRRASSVVNTSLPPCWAGGTHQAPGCRTHPWGSELRGKAAGSSMGGHCALRLQASCGPSQHGRGGAQGRGAWWRP